jgi:hypothetical protein
MDDQASREFIFELKTKLVQFMAVNPFYFPESFN